MKKISHKNKSGRIFTASFFILFLVFCFSVFRIFYYKTYSGSDAKDINKLISQSVPFETEFKKISSLYNNSFGENDINEVFFTNGKLLKKSKQQDKEALSQTASDINLFTTVFSVPTYISVVPTSAAVYSDIMPGNDDGVNQKTYISEFYSQLETEVKKINVYNSLDSSKNDYIFYRTDSLWTSYGAYCGYKKIIRKFGFTPVDFSQYSISHVDTEFYGDLYERSEIFSVEPDCIDRYICIKGSKILEVTNINNGIPEKTDSIYYDQYTEDNEYKLDYFLGKDNNLINIRTNVGNNKNLLIFKDRYADQMIEFLAQHYTTITIVDLEKINENNCGYIRSNLMNGYTEVLFLCGFETAMNNEIFGNLEKLYP